MKKNRQSSWFILVLCAGLLNACSPNLLGNPLIEAKTSKPTVPIGKTIGKGKSMLAMGGPPPTAPLSPATVAPPSPVQNATPGSTTPSPSTTGSNSFVSSSSTGIWFDVSIDPDFFQNYFVTPAQGMKWTYKNKADLAKLSQAMQSFTPGSSTAPPVPFSEMMEIEMSYEVQSIQDDKAKLKLLAIPIKPKESQYTAVATTSVKAPLFLLGLAAPDELVSQTKPPDSPSVPTIDINLTITGVENVTVPAGTYNDAVKIEAKMDLVKAFTKMIPPESLAKVPPDLLANFPSMADEMWVTREAGLIKRVTYIVSKDKKSDYMTQELQSFKK